MAAHKDKQKTQRQKSEKRGKSAETIACFWLMLKGYRIIHRRFKNKLGEIDIIAKRGKTIVFTEVKYRKAVSTALESISHTQRRRIEKTAQLWLKNTNYNDVSPRFDIIAVAPRRFPIHITNAWLLGE